MKKIKRMLSIFIALSIAFVFYLYFENNNIKVTRYEVISAKLPSEFDGYKIIQLTDLHGKQYSGHAKSLVNHIRTENPNIIVLTGDMIDSTSKNGNVVIELVGQLINQYPIYYISGNHELIAKNNVDWVYQYEKELENLGVIILDNKVEYIEYQQARIKISGIVPELLYYSSKDVMEEDDIHYTHDDIIENIGKVDIGYFNILLSHTPTFFDAYSYWGADLSLTGHMHGGIVHIPFIGGVFSPDKSYFPKYDYGVYYDNGSSMIVSSGLGDSSGTFRIFNRPEIVSITLKK